MTDSATAALASGVLERLGQPTRDPDRLERLLAERDAALAAERSARLAEWHTRRPSVRAERLEAELRRMGVRLSDEDLHRVVEGELESTQALRGVQRFWRESERRFCVMLGPVGVGKTLASVWLGMQPAVEAVDRWLEWLDRSDEPLADLRRDRLHIPTCEWLSAPDVPARWSPWRDERAIGVQPLHRDAPVLIIDDLGTERLTDRWVEAFGQLVDYRQTVGRTVLSTNLPRGTLRQRYGDRTADRLNHSGVALQLSGTSMRRQGAGL